EEFYRKSLEMGHEGVMAKNLDAPYQPGSRVGYMYKIKPVMETLDLVITGATWGEGRRASWLGSFLLSVYDPETGELLEMGRMATGLTDQQLEEMTELLKPTVTLEDGKEVKLRPTTVVEVAYEEIQKSPTYSSGYALRFPRLVRVREDKGIEEADNIRRVEEILAVNSKS
ncbi:MAG: DNA ligase, partial [Candidatus Altiarchaeota archaeon]|nr:DNA ligase [Candidatus Altiarchaeota archaeon]